MDVLLGTFLGSGNVLLSAKEAAKLLDVSEKTVYRWISSGKIPHARAGDQYRFSRGELLAWAASAGRPVSPDALREPESAGEPLPPLSEALEEGGIHYKVGGSTPWEVIGEIARMMRLPAGVDRSYVGEVITAREAVASTAVGDGIAIPHMRHPLLQADRPSVTLCFLADPVDWKAVDGLPVRIVFVPCCPTMRSHLHLLSRLSFAARDPEWRGLLDREALRADLLNGLRRAEARFGTKSGGMST